MRSVASMGRTRPKRISVFGRVNESMTTDGTTTTTELEIIEPTSEACMMGVQFAFDAALALF